MWMFFIANEHYAMLKSYGGMYSLHAPDHVLKYVPTHVLDHLYTNQNLGPETES